MAMTRTIECSRPRTLRALNAVMSGRRLSGWLIRPALCCPAIGVVAILLTTSRGAWIEFYMDMRVLQ